MLVFSSCYLLRILISSLVNARETEIKLSFLTNNTFTIPLFANNTISKLKTSSLPVLSVSGSTKILTKPFVEKSIYKQIEFKLLIHFTVCWILFYKEKEKVHLFIPFHTRFLLRRVAGQQP